MKFGLQKKMALSFSAFLVIVFGFSCWGIVAYTTRLSCENIQKQQFALTELIAHSIDDKLGYYLVSITQIASVAPAEAFKNPATAQAFLDSHRDLSNLFDNGIKLYDNKRVLIAESPFVKGMRGSKETRLEPFLKNVGNSDFPDISKPYLSLKANTPTIAVAAPITDRSNRLSGFLVGSINLTKDFFIQEILGYKIGEKGYLYLFNTDRTMILHPDKKRIMRQDIPPGANRLLDRAIAGFEGSGETINSRGIPQIASFKRLKMTDWILATAYPQKEAYAPIRRLRGFIIGAAILITLLSIVLVWLLTRRVTASFTNFTDQIRHMREDTDCHHEIIVDHGDEISELATTFNGLLRDLDQARNALDTLTRTDPLTGLHNRRHLELEAPKLIAISERNNASTALLMIDIDFFKRINDTYGHGTGDEVLVHLAELFRQKVRPYDLAVRLGGEEFLLILPQISEQDALVVAERFRQTIQDTPVVCNQAKLAITVSIGVYVAEEIHDLEEAISRADAALYQAKNSGRNRVCLTPNSPKKSTSLQLHLENSDTYNRFLNLVVRQQSA